MAIQGVARSARSATARLRADCAVRVRWRRYPATCDIVREVLIVHPNMYEQAEGLFRELRMNAVNHSGHDFVDVDGSAHHISFQGIVARPSVLSQSRGKGPVGILSYETEDGVTHRHTVSANAASSVLDSFDRWDAARTS